VRCETAVLTAWRVLVTTLRGPRVPDDEWVGGVSPQRHPSGRLDWEEIRNLNCFSRATAFFVCENEGFEHPLFA